MHYLPSSDRAISLFFFFGMGPSKINRAHGMHGEQNKMENFKITRNNEITRNTIIFYHTNIWSSMWDVWFLHLPPLRATKTQASQRIRAVSLDIAACRHKIWQWLRLVQLKVMTSSSTWYYTRGLWKRITLFLLFSCKPYMRLKSYSHVLMYNLELAWISR